MKTKWSDLTDAEKVLRLTAGRADKRQSQLEREQDAEVDFRELEEPGHFERFLASNELGDL